MIGYFGNTSMSESNNHTPRKREHGGGFLPDASNAALSPPMHGATTYSSPSSKKPNMQNPTLRPFTLKQLADATQSHAEAGFKVDDCEIQQCMVMGCIRAVHQQAAGITYTIEDGTGALDVRRWIDTGLSARTDEEDPESESNVSHDDFTTTTAQSQFREGVWVRVVGNLRSFSSKKSLNIYDIRPVNNFNEFIHHMASCIQSHYHYAKGISISNVSKFLRPANVTAAATHGGGDGGALGAAPYSGMGGASTTMGSEHGSELSSAQQMVLSLFAGCTANEGLNIDTACRSLKSKLREEETRVIVDWLIDEGHLYLTIDNHHAKSTSG